MPGPLSAGEVQPATDPAKGAGSEVLLSGTGLTKRYGNVTVLSDVDFELRAAEVLAVVGENGAGKSTLMKIIAGVIPAGDHDGEICVHGAPVEFTSIRASGDHGVVLVPQELHVVPHFTIAENMFQGHLPGRLGIYDEQAAFQQAREALAIFDLDFKPSDLARTLSPAQRRLIVLAGALYRSAKVLILDEPTAALTDSEAEVLLGHLRKLRDHGVGIIYITHRLDELDQIADRVLALRNGVKVADFESVPSRSELVGAMLGSELKELREIARSAAAEVGVEPVLQVQDLCVYTGDGTRRPRAQHIAFDLYPGEVLGLYGLVGAGRSELARALYGAWPGPVDGTVRIAGSTGLPRSPSAAVRRGMTLLGEDRKSQGLLPGQSVARNMTPSMLLRQFSSKRIFIDQGRERHRVDELMGNLGVRPGRTDLPIDALSGGNQQKVLLGRCLVDGLKVLILDEPTLGVDVGARKDIFHIVRSVAQEFSVGVLLISSDVDEVLTEADRILVMYKTKICAEFPRGSTAHDLLSAATGAQ